MAKRVKVVESTRDELRSRVARFGAIADRFASWRPAGEVLTRVVAQPTIFVQYDLATKVGGHPLQRVALVHGPSSQGKTCFALGLGLSFLAAGHVFAYVDSEMTTPDDWLQKLMVEQSGNPGFLAQRPHSYEEVVVGVRELLTGMKKARDAEEIDAGTSALVVIDSIRKLVPKGLLDKMLKGDAGIDGAKGRGAMMKAALNAQWLDELVPLLYYTNSSLLFIAREFDNPDASPWEVDYKVAGGKAVLYDSSLAMRITRDGHVKSGTGKEAVVLGERHRVTIHKTKVSAKEQKVSVAHFHTSNGLRYPEGFDRASDIVEAALACGLFEKKAGWVNDTETGERWREGALTQALRDDPKTLAVTEQNVRAKWKDSAADHIAALKGDE